MTAYVGIAWFLRKIRIYIFSYIPFQYGLLLMLGLAVVAYLGDLRLTGEDRKSSKAQRTGRPYGNSRSDRLPASPKSINEEPDTLRHEMDNIFLGNPSRNG